MEHPRARPDTSVPDISIVVAICDGGAALRACLDALMARRRGVSAEVIVPYDHASPDAAAMAADFPEVRFIDLGAPDGGRLPRNAVELHRLWDIRRAEGVRQARGRLIGMVEDRGIPAPDWAEAMVALHDEHPEAAAIGGCIDNGLDTTWNWAIHFCEFARYLAPQPATPADALSATNISYRAADLLALRPLYAERFYEPQVHAAFQAAGKPLILADRARTTQRRPRIGTASLLSEWYFWGLYYGRMQAGKLTPPQRAVRALATPALPFVQTLRHYRNQRRKGLYGERFRRAAPLVFLISAMWALGECAGYLRGPDRTG